MGLGHSPRIVTDGLVLCLDAANPKGYDKYENLALNSEAINSWANNGGAISVSANSQIAPNGTLTADVLSQTAVTGASRWVSSRGNYTYTSGVTYTLSVWLKKISGTDAQPSISLWVNLSGFVSQSVGTLTTEWVRYSRTFTASTTNGTNTFTGLGIGWNETGVANNFTFAAWGFQVEIGSSVTDYYATTSTAKNRGTIWSDLSGNGNIGELVNSPTYNSSNLGYFQFVTDDYARIPNNTALDTQTPTVEVWVKTNATNQNGFWFEKGTVNTQYSLFQEGTGIQWRQNIGGITNLTTTTATYMNTTSWYQVVGTYTSGTRRLYINGTLVNSDTQSGTIATDTGGMSIGVYGGYSGGRGYYYNGNLGVCRVYTRALSAAEVQQNFNALRGRFGI